MMHKMQRSDIKMDTNQTKDILKILILTGKPI